MNSDERHPRTQPRKDTSDAKRWTRLARELDINATVAGSPTSGEENPKLEVVGAELLFPSGEDEATVVVRVKTNARRVLEFDMALPWDAIVDATADYAEVDGELVKHDFDMTKPEEVDRYLGRESNTGIDPATWGGDFQDLEGCDDLLLNDRDLCEMLFSSKHEGFLAGHSLGTIYGRAEAAGEQAPDARTQQPQDA